MVAQIIKSFDYVIFVASQEHSYVCFNKMWQLFMITIFAGYVEGLSMT